MHTQILLSSGLIDSISQLQTLHVQEKRRAYDERIQEVEKASFSP